MNNQFKNPTFGGFKPNAMQRIAGTLGYTGDMSGFNSYLEQNPDKKNQMEQFKQAAMMMAKGGVVRNFQTGGTITDGFGNAVTDGSGNPVTNRTYTELTGLPDPTANDKPADFSQGIQTLQGPTSKGNTTYYKVGDSTFQDYQSALNHYNTSGGAQQPMVQAMPQQGQTIQQNAAGTFDIVDASGKIIKTNIDTQQQAQQMIGQQQPYAPFDIPITTMPIPDLGDYDPTKGMPELSESDYAPFLEQIAGGSTGAGAENNIQGITAMLSSGNFPADPTKYEITGKSGDWTITYADGKTLKSPYRKLASIQNEAENIANVLNQAKQSDTYTGFKNQQDAYRNFLSSGVTGGVTGDIENIEQEFNTAQSNYTQLQLELTRLSNQAKANPDDPYLKELVEAKGKEFSDAKLRLDQLTPLYQSTQKTIADVMTGQATDPTLPEGAKQQATLIGAPMQEELIKQTSGQVGTGAGEFGVSQVAQADTYLAQNVEQPDTAKYEADVRADQVAAQTQALNAAQTNEDDVRAQVSAATATASMVGDLNAAQGTAIQFNNEVTRELQDGEIIDGASTDAVKAAEFTEAIDAATATPSEKATVQGQMVSLMEQFDGGKTPAWASGAIRLANQQMAARGLSSSSMAGQAIIQATMESALPIAQADAQTIASFEAQNLSNRQQRAMLAAEQRAAFLGQEFDQDFQTRVLKATKISDIANMNFTADQQIQLENARIVTTMNMENLNNRQSMVLAEAAALANLDMGNLNNRQQTSVQNAQNFLSMDLANLSNEQQTEIFKSQQIIQSMLTDQAANNAAMQFNAQSENQANQFYDNLNSSINMFNSEQSNAQERFNAGQVNAMSQFNAEMKNQREQFNASNQLVIDQSNAQWRREIATQDTAAINRANEMNALATLNISNTAYNNMWQMYSDQMSYAFKASESEADRLNNIALQQLANDASFDLQNMKNDYNSSAAFGGAIVKLLTSSATDSIFGGWFS